MTTFTVRLKVRREDPSSGNPPVFQEYSIEAYKGMTVLEALQRIYQGTDHTLAIHGYACYRLVCGLCLYRVNGKNVLACRTPVEDGMVIEPPAGRKVIRDLAADVT